MADNPVNSPELKTREFSSDAEVERLVFGFESATISPSHFDHSAHLATALYYLEEGSFAQALDRMRSALRRFTAHHGVDVYHETITTFWVRLLHHLTENEYRAVPLWRRINLITTRWGGAEPLEAHYSRELLRSQRARQEWVEPDLLPMPFLSPPKCKI